MRALALLLVLTGVAEAEPVDPGLEARAAHFESGHARAARLELRDMDVLVAGGIVSVAGGAGMMATSRYDQGVRIAGGLSLGYGLVNLTLGVLSFPGSKRDERRFAAGRDARRTPEGLLAAQRDELLAYKKKMLLYGINLGLDGGYVVAGVTAVIASQLGADHPDRWLGAGLALCVQGAFDAAIDLVAVIVANRRFNAVLREMQPAVGVSPTPGGARADVGISGRF